MVGSVTSVDKLPSDILVRILSFCCVEDVLSCYKLCRKFHRALQPDEAWDPAMTISSGQSYAGDPRLPTNRSRACMTRALCYTRRESNSCSNILHEVLGYTGSLAALRSLGVDDDDIAFQLRVPHPPLNANVDKPFFDRVYLRGDTLATLLELAQTNTLRILEKSNETYIRFGATAVAEAAIESGQSTTNFPEYSHRQLAVYLRINGLPDMDTGPPMQVSRETRDRIVLRLIRRAGIVKLSSEENTYSRIWDLLSNILLSTLTTTKLYISSRSNGQPLLRGQSIRDVPSRHMTDEGGRHRFVLIPRFVEDAFRFRGFPIHKVYGDEWYARVEDGTDVEEAVEAERERACLLYTLPDEEDEEMADSDDGSSSASCMDDFLYEAFEMEGFEEEDVEIDGIWAFFD